MNITLTDRLSYYLSAIVFVLASIFFIWESGDIMQSLFAAFLAGALFFISYTLVRWLVLAIKT